MKVIRGFITMIARFFISLVFLAGAVNKILHWHEAEKSLINTLSDWQMYTHQYDGMQDLFSILIPMAPVLLLMATFFEFVGGLCVLLGIKEKLGAALLIIFLIPTTIFIHQFWFVEGAAREMQLAHFLKNIAILGGLFMIMLHGTEKPSDSFPMKF
jgi:uncharacterized membrane protein YphA (DoxX/SURF4 family)